MKKKFLLFLPLLFCQLLGFGQTDWEGSFANYAAGQTVVVDKNKPQPFQIQAINQSSSDAMISSGDIFVFSYEADNKMYDANGTLNAWSGIKLSQDLTLATGAGLNLPNWTVDFSKLPTMTEFCVVVAGFNADGNKVINGAGSNSEQYIVDDPETSNNRVCVKIEYEVSSVDNFENSISNIFYANEAISFTSTGLSTGENVKLNLVNLAGQTIISENVDMNQGNTQIPVGSLIPGIYLVQFSTGNKMFTKKIAVQ